MERLEIKSIFRLQEKLCDMSKNYKVVSKMLGVTKGVGSAHQNKGENINININPKNVFEIHY
jgi:hypothetical protein